MDTKAKNNKELVIFIVGVMLATVGGGGSYFCSFINE
jgi:hypothetical protein